MDIDKSSVGDKLWLYLVTFELKCCAEMVSRDGGVGVMAKRVGIAMETNWSVAKWLIKRFRHPKKP
jgi:hypothetical protein